MGVGGATRPSLEHTRDGAVAAAKGEPMRDMHWAALRQFACGCMPQWEAIDRKAGTRVRGVVGEAIRGVQSER